MMNTNTTERQFEKYTTRTTNRKFNLVFAQQSFVLGKKQVDIIVYKNGGMIGDQSLSIPSYYVSVNKHSLNKFETSKVLTKQYDRFDDAIRLYNNLLQQYNKAGYGSGEVVKKDIKQFWNGYFEQSVVYRTKATSDQLIDDIVLSISNVVDNVAINYIQQYRQPIVDIVEQLGIAKASLRDITDKVTYQSGSMIFDKCFNKWNKLATELVKPNDVFGNVSIPICNINIVNNVTQKFRLYSNYCDRYQ